MLSTKYPMDPNRKEDLLDVIQELFYSVQAAPIIHPCTACVFFKAPTCTKWNAQPPEKVVQETGCPEWQHIRNIPF